MKENIKIGLLGVIALTVVINTFFMDDVPRRRVVSDDNGMPQSNVAITPPSNNGLVNPINPLTNQPTNQPPVAATPKLSESRPKTNIKFAETSHNFGTIKQETQNTKIFKFTNTGSEPLIIEDAVGSCGCTVPKFPKEPIKPGQTGDIEVVYSPGQQQGSQSKTVTITANTEPLTTTINISAEVEVAK